MVLGIIAVFVPIYKPVERLVVLICPKCHARIPVSSKFCSECGVDLRQQSFQNKEKNSYNAACFASVAGEIDQAFEFLQKALKENPSLASWAKEDPDLSWIRDDPRFWKILGEHDKGS